MQYVGPPLTSLIAHQLKIYGISLLLLSILIFSSSQDNLGWFGEEKNVEELIWQKRGEVLQRGVKNDDGTITIHPTDPSSAESKKSSFDFEFGGTDTVVEENEDVILITPTATSSNDAHAANNNNKEAGR